MTDNLAAILCSLLDDKAVKAEQWKLLGQEKDGSLLVGWVEESSERNSALPYSVIGHYDRAKGTLQIVYKFSQVLNVVQATINQYHTLLGYVIKTSIVVDDRKVETDCATVNEGSSESDTLEVYRVYVVDLCSPTKTINNLELERSKQARIQFLYKQRPQRNLDQFLVLIHQESVMLYNVHFDNTNDGTYTLKELKSESLVRTFIWAQWDSVNQVLYHIHHRRSPTSLVTEEASDSQQKTPGSCPTLSGLQFHDDLPHETVLNIPLNLPQLPDSSHCGTYEDDVIPLRVHDCSLDLIVVSDPKGMVCICHHYLYRPDNHSADSIDNNCLSDMNTVHFAYSVTVLHHSCVIHCVIPGIPWTRAKLMRPTFVIHGDHHMVVFVQGAFTHLLEIGVTHEPCCHILSGPLPCVPWRTSYLVPLLDLTTNNPNDGNNSKRRRNSSERSRALKIDENFGPTGTNVRTGTFINTENYSTLISSTPNPLTVDLPTLDLVTLTIPVEFLIEEFRKETSLDVRLGILHYFLVHRNDPESVMELVSAIAEQPKLLSVARLLQEILISGSYAAVQKNLPADAPQLTSLLPFTTMQNSIATEVIVNDLTITLTHEKLWNTSVMLLSPQQRLVPYCNDLWTRLWDQLGRCIGDKPRFKPSQVAEKLMVSLACYQPEALSRSSTPMSPSGGLAVAAASMGELMGCRGNSKILDSGLPFVEVESCTASKQEHVVSVNLRELSMHLLKHGTQTSTMRLQGICTPLHLHAMATRHVAAQLETSRSLCQMLCRASNVDPRTEQKRGFDLIDQLDESRLCLLFTLLERYSYAIEGTAFPLPQGFTSFFTYLGYRSLNYPTFLQYVRKDVFELQVDVMKAIMADSGESKAGVCQKLGLLSLLPRSRAKRLLNQWLHPVSLMLRAREHATNILSGELCQCRGRIPQHRIDHNGLAAFPSADRLSPLDTFLDLLTAKASLTELDFGLLIEATVTSTEDFL
ncbi:protein pigeon [Athalia rosae]|uniref:protein pigeon n=1 Tax=Athalia rosae TaxID=37344 RepID=UPI00203370FC|nr:protein pigeon [Athalia rosae]